MTQSTQKKNEKNRPAKSKGRKKRVNRTVVVFWVCLVLLITPFAILGWILFSSTLTQHTPVIGNRYDGDLDPAITSSEMSDIQTKTAAIGGVQSADVQMATATLRVYADISDDATAETATAVANEIYSQVSSVLDPSVYFTKTDSMKMYDLEIHVYTTGKRTDAEGENFVYVIETKTSSMDAPAAQTVSTARDPELAKSLEDAVTARKAEASASDTTGSGTDVQDASAATE